MKSELLVFLCENVPQFRASRLPALYSDFGYLSTTNPDGYTANVSAWLQGLAKAARAGVLSQTNVSPDLLSLTLSQELLQALETENGRPLALGKAIQEGITTGQLILFQDFLELPQSVYQKSWSLRPWKLLMQGLRQLAIFGNYIGEYEISKEKLVVLENLEVAGKEVKRRYDSFQARSEKVFTRASFQNEFGLVLGSKIPLSDSDMELLLKFLSRDMTLICYNAEIVKFRSPNDTDNITIEDRTLASLKQFIRTIDNQTQDLSRKIDELSCAAKLAVSKKNRVAALAALQSKKLAYRNLEKRYATLAQLEEVFSKIEQAADQVELVRIMNDSTQVLTGLNKQVGGMVKVENIIEKLEEQIKLVDEIGTQTELGITIDEGEIDDELEAMEQDDNEKIKVREDEYKKKGELETSKKFHGLEEIESKLLTAKETPLNDSDLQKKLAESTELMKDLSFKPDISILG